MTGTPPTYSRPKRFNRKDRVISSSFFGFARKKPAASATGKVALVTGGSRGIGAAIAGAFAAAGYAVCINYRTDAEAAKAVETGIMAQGGRAACFKADIGREDEVAALMEFCSATFGGLHVLVNNAGISPGCELDKIDGAYIDKIYTTNVTGTLLATKHAARLFGSDGGAVVNISSIWGIEPTAGNSVYSSSKAAVNAITVGLARELGPRGIRVNAVAPGVTMTAAMKKNLPGKVAKQLADATPLRDIGTPEDIAAVVLYLASDEARWVTGQIITASGGAV